jgi:hypothetical protein
MYVMWAIQDHFLVLRSGFSSPPSHLTVQINAILKPSRHTIYLFINEPLGHLLPSLFSQLTCFKLIPMREPLKKLLWWTPAVLNWRQIWTIRAVEVMR